ncbi:hypothetical protein POM88_045425 [Heracleum sosnowskyi]|uniref:Uncharacterized protein n=1 Tax=Heracleum sosnowskyi TaxID=360622 RepID=A0AAD8H5W6_9APIA|nr:hypothetical protein POM88_045425 [Heracleum sosnowskyi]
MRPRFQAAQRSPEQAPQCSPGQAPMRSPGQAPLRSLGQAPLRSPGQALQKTQQRTPEPELTQQNMPENMLNQTPQNTPQQTPEQNTPDESSLVSSNDLFKNCWNPRANALTRSEVSCMKDLNLQGGSASSRTHASRLAEEWNRDPNSTEIFEYMHAKMHDKKTFINKKSAEISEKLNALRAEHCQPTDGSSVPQLVDENRIRSLQDLRKLENDCVLHCWCGSRLNFHVLTIN